MHSWVCSSLDLDDKKTSRSTIGSVANEDMTINEAPVLARHRPRWTPKRFLASTHSLHLCLLLPSIIISRIQYDKGDSGLSILPIITFCHNTTDMEHEEERGGSGEEEAKDKCSPDPSAKRLVHHVIGNNTLFIAIDGF